EVKRRGVEGPHVSHFLYLQFFFYAHSGVSCAYTATIMKPIYLNLTVVSLKIILG
ncbi:hypothetical protein ACJX0J_027804, partial [Zea mays]